MTDRLTILQLQKELKNAQFTIQRQNVEIERLKEKCDSLDLVIDNKKNEIRRLKYRVNKLENYDAARDAKLHSKLRKQARAEGMKEFWEELKKRNTMDERIVSVDSGDKLLTELI